jgi:hypothetical protein
MRDGECGLPRTIGRDAPLLLPASRVVRSYRVPLSTSVRIALTSRRDERSHSPRAPVGRSARIGPAEINLAPWPENMSWVDSPPRFSFLTVRDSCLRRSHQLASSPVRSGLIPLSYRAAVSFNHGYPTVDSLKQRRPYRMVRSLQTKAEAPTGGLVGEGVTSWASRGQQTCPVLPS